LKILKYLGGTYKKELLSEEEISLEQKNDDPFAEVDIQDDDLPF
jgi:hypothetical protein